MLNEHLVLFQHNKYQLMGWRNIYNNNIVICAAASVALAGMRSGTDWWMTGEGESP